MRPRLQRFSAQLNRTAHLPRSWGNRLIVGSLALAAALGIALLAVTPDDGPAAAEFGARVPGQHVYDQTGLLSSADLTAIDRRATAIEQAGIPVVVYVRPVEAGSSDTRDDARALMRSWGVESRPGAADGLVLFLDVDHQDVHSDNVALITGAQLTKNRFPAREAERISSNSVVGLTTVVDPSRELAATINFNLAASERRLLLGFPTAPAPSTAERTAATFARYLMPIVSVVLALLASLAIGLIWRGRPRPIMAVADVLPDSPILRAALAANRVDQSVCLVAVRRLVSQGAVASPTAGPVADAAQPDRIELLDRSRAGDDLDRAAWDELASVAVAGVVDQHGLALIAHRSGLFSRAVTAELERRGWWDTMASRRAVPLVLMSQGLLVAGGVTLVVALAVGEVWGLFAIALLVLTAAVAWACAQAYPRATPLGLAVVRQTTPGEAGW